MLDITFLNECIVPVIVGICLCVGYVIKSSLDFIPNKYIPLIMLVVGLVINIWINKSISPDIVLGGMFSGLSSTGMHQVFKNLIQDK